MHSSAISLLYKLEDRKLQKEENSIDSNNNYIIHLIDSPGHIDFSSDVSTATRLCDGALIVIDVLEGLCTQTHAVLYKALKERMRPCLVLNKIDRLVLELQMTTTEAFHHLRRVLENANALASSLLNSEIIRMREREGIHGGGGDPSEALLKEEERLTSDWNFAPEKGNVIFAAALDSWGFGTGKFATIYSQRLGVNRAVLLKYFFEDFSLNTDTKKLARCDAQAAGSAEPLFAKYILEPIWTIYQTCVTQNNVSAAADIAKRELNVTLTPREINPRDSRGTLQAIMRRWLSLPDALLRMVVRCVPSPLEAQRERLSTLFYANPGSRYSQLVPGIDPSQNAIRRVCSRMESVVEGVAACRKGALLQECDSSDRDSGSDVVVYIAKMTEIRVAELTQEDLRMLTERHTARAILNPDSDSGGSGLGETVFMGLARVYSGVLRRDSRLFVLGHHHDPLSVLSTSDVVDSSQSEWDPDVAPPGRLATATEIPPHSLGLYLCFGPSVYPIQEAPAGNVVGIVGIEDFVLKTGTLASTWASPPMAAITFQAKPLVRVAVEPMSHRDLHKLEAGLQSLFQYDPVVEVGVDDSGQHTMTCLGELHLEQCLKVLIERFAKCEVKVSAPLVPFRETVIAFDSESSPSRSAVTAAASLPPPWKDLPGLSRSTNGRVRMASASGQVTISLRCCSIPMETAVIMEDGIAGALAELAGVVNTKPHSFSEIPESVQSFWRKMVQSLATSASEGKGDHAWAALGDETLSELSEFGLLDRIIAFGPKGCGCNMLLFHPEIAADIWDSHDLSHSSEPDQLPKMLVSLKRGKSAGLETCDISFADVWGRFQSSCLAGFQAAVAAGPLMQEPLHGVCFVLESIEVTATAAGLSSAQIHLLRQQAHTSDGVTDQSSQVPTDAHVGSGQLLSEIRDAIRLSMLSLPLRVVEPVYECNLQCDQSQLGSLYGVLSRRRGKVTREDIIEGTSLFILTAHLPVSESFGFAQELLKKTSGLGTAPQLLFSHWSVHDDDPFWKPTTAEELEDFGEQVAEANQARKFIDAVRKRKGLPIEEKIVVHAEKQRTLTKMK